jgi:anti-sigma factor RsiW
MNCADFEILLADYVDGQLLGEHKSAFEAHLSSCAECRELAEDAKAAVGFMERAALVEAPPELVTRILFEVSSGPSHAVVKPSWIRRVLGRRLETVLQPRFAMGMAMTVLSFAMLGRFSGIQVRQLKAADLDPVKVWTSVEDRVHRSWERAIKYYENLRLVYEIQSRLKDWTEEAPAPAQGQAGKQPAQPVPTKQESPPQ